MMWVNKELAYRMETCIKLSHMAVTEQYDNGRILEVNGGTACFSGVDSFLSQVVGWGFATKPKHFEKEIGQIEQFYKSLDHIQVDIEVCPFAGAALAVCLSHRGYGISELSQVSVLDLKNYYPKKVSHELLIREVKSDEFMLWAQQTALGFGYPEAKDQFIHYIQAKGVTLFAAYDHGTIVAGAALVTHGDVGDLCLTSTLSGYRGRGLQKKLISARLNFAKQLGLNMVTVTTDAGSISDNNIQKSGFVCAYTRIKMTLIL